MEGLSESLLAAWRQNPHAQCSLILSGARANYLKTNDKNTESVCIDANALSFADIIALADPLSENPIPKSTILPNEKTHNLLIVMAKHAALLPAVIVVKNIDFPTAWLHVPARDAAHYWNEPPLEIVPIVRALLPNTASENATILCFRQRYGTSTHLAMIFGDINQMVNPVVRIHSSCITGDILGSLRCDCGEQLHRAIHKLSISNNGILLYLHQEGRGIGIANKLRAYALQERGIDTYQANLMIGFQEDERDFAIAATILKQLGLSGKPIRLMTNNPRKIEHIEKYGISVESRVPLVADANPHNQLYLDAKKHQSGHLF